MHTPQAETGTCRMSARLVEHATEHEPVWSRPAPTLKIGKGGVTRQAPVNAEGDQPGPRSGHADAPAASARPPKTPTSGVSFRAG
jgi:hypothetical protein